MAARQTWVCNSKLRVGKGTVQPSISRQAAQCWHTTKSAQSCSDGFHHQHRWAWQPPSLTGTRLSPHRGLTARRLSPSASQPCQNTASFFHSDAQLLEEDLLKMISKFDLWQAWLKYFLKENTSQFNKQLLANSCSKHTEFSPDSVGLSLLQAEHKNDADHWVSTGVSALNSTYCQKDFFKITVKTQTASSGQSLTHTTHMH